jgi:hypothetical protein
MLKAISGSALIMMIFGCWVLLAGAQEERINRSCQPILWFGNVLESVALLTVDSWSDAVKEQTLDLDYGCRYVVWRVFYEEEYLEFRNQR